MCNRCKIINRFCKNNQPNNNHPKDTQPNQVWELTLIITKVNIMTFSIQTLRTMTQSKETCSLLTVSKTALDTMTSASFLMFFCHLFQREKTTGDAICDLLSYSDYNFRKKCNDCEIINRFCFCKDT